MSTIQTKGVKLTEDTRGGLTAEAQFFLPNSTLDEAFKVSLPVVTTLPYIRREVSDGERGAQDHYITAHYGGLITEPRADGDQSGR